MPFLTVDDIDEPAICWRVSLPPSLSKVFFGLILEASYTWNWEQFGTSTPEECALKFDAILNTDPIIPCEELLSVPIGSVLAIATADIPAHCLLCDGSTYDSADYPELAAVLHETFISGDEFTVPDLRARFIVGAGTFASSGAASVGASGGADKHQLSIGELAAHKHPVNDDGTAEYHLHANDPTGSISRNVWTVNAAGGWNKIMSETGSKGLNNAHNNLPPYFVLRYAIVAESPT